MRINHNIAALNTYRQLTGNVGSTGKSLEKLSSGLRINKAGDDAAGLAISEKMRAQIRGLDQASRNASDAISLIQTAEGALTETHSILQRMRELAVQSATDTNTIDDRKEIQKEINNLVAEVDRIAKETQFNKQTLLDGGYTGHKFHIGANSDQTLTADVSDMQAAALGKGAATDIKASAEKVINGATVKISAVDAGSEYDGIEVEIKIAAVNESDNAADWNAAMNKLTVTIGKDDVGALKVTNATGLKDLINGATVSGGAGTEGAGPQLTVSSTGAAGAITLAATTFDKLSGGATGVEALKTEGNASAIGVTNREGADAAINTIDAAIRAVSSERAKLGGIQNRLDHTINNLGATSENLAASESRIRDVDMAKEMMEFTKNNILSQASQAMLAQANMQPQSVLQLLQ